jgi:transposase
MRLLKPGVKTTGMNIQHPTEQANRPATGVVTDKGVPQSDSFAKYAAAFLICPVRR